MSTELFPLIPRPRGQGPIGSTADIPLTLELGAVRAKVVAVLEPGAAYGVLPRSVGRRLGATWSRHTIPVLVPGRRDPVQAIPLTVTGFVASFPAVPLAFAWASSDRVPVVLGQISFLHQFDVCLHHGRSHVEVRPAALPVP
jgi:hypothetical protein